jgi:hypothetical protein
MKFLIISDIHQDIPWVESVLKKEKGNFDRVIFNGDWMDSFLEHPDVFTAKETAQWIANRIDSTDDIFLLGNHDLPYMESHRNVTQFYSPPSNIKNYCSGITSNKLKDFNKVFTKFHWDRFKIYYFIGNEHRGHLVSHAGITPQWYAGMRAYEYTKFIKDKFKEEYNNDIEFRKHHNHISSMISKCDSVQISPVLDYLKEEEPIVLSKIYNGVTNHPLFAVSRDRGGMSPHGGIFWADWTEFAGSYAGFDHPTIGNQIVGHSTSYKNVRSHHTSYCIDGYQTAYAIADFNGKVDIKYVDNPNADKIENVRKKQYQKALELGLI